MNCQERIYKIIHTYIYTHIHIHIYIHIHTYIHAYKHIAIYYSYYDCDCDTYIACNEKVWNSKLQISIYKTVVYNSDTFKLDIMSIRFVDYM